MKMRTRRLMLIGISTIALVILAIIAGIYLVIKGGKPLENGEHLANDRVIIATNGFIASYIILLGNGEVALVDAGFDPEAKTVKSILAKNGFSTEDVSAIFFTHGHGDHIAGAHSFPGANLFALEPDVDLIEGRRTADSLFARNRTPKRTGLTISKALHDGDNIRIADTLIKVFAVPGHTRGSAAFLIDGILFLGDSAAAASDGTISGAPPVFSADREENRRALINLADRLRSRKDQIKILAFGHQGPVNGIEPLMVWARQNR